MTILLKVTMNEEDSRFILDVNLMSTIFSCQAASVPMKKKHWGRIVTVSSGAAFAGQGLVSYSIAKATILRFTRSLAWELGPHGINVNCIAPGVIGSSRALAQFPERRKMGETVPLAVSESPRTAPR